MEENYTRVDILSKEHHDAENSVVVSVIVPMYMCEEYVAGVLDNLSAQSFKDIEIICVVDGSPDQTLARVEECAAKDSRIRVFNREHSGAGAARNYGLSVSRGEYVLFLDADDVYFPNFISRMLRAIEDNDADIATCCFVQQNSLDGSIQKDFGIDKRFLPKVDVVNPSQSKYMISAFTSAAHNKMFRKSFLLSNGLLFSTTESINDVFFSLAGIICADRVALVWENLYIYRVYHNSNSISSNRDYFREDLFTVFSDLYKWLKEQGKAEYFLNSFCLRWRGAFHSYARYGVCKEFQDRAVRFFSEEEPWINMSGKELQRMAGLGTEPTKIRRLQSIRRKRKALPNTKEYEAADREINYRDCIIENVDAIRKQLERECSRYNEMRDNLPRAVYWRGSDYLKRYWSGRVHRGLKRGNG